MHKDYRSDDINIVYVSLIKKNWIFVFKINILITYDL